MLSEVFAGCGRGRRGKEKYLKVTDGVEKMIVRYAHPVYDRTVESYPVGICGYCYRELFLCKKAEGQNEEIKKDQNVPVLNWRW